MFSLFKANPLKKLQKQYNQLLEQALAAQRRGDIRSYSELASQSEELARQIDELKAA